MHSLSNIDVLRIWETGLHQHPQERALMMLAFACPDTSCDDLASMSVGTRDSLLIELFEKTFGKSLQGFAVCPGCKADLEFDMSTKDVGHPRVALGAMDSGEPKLLFEGLEIEYRLPQGRDLIIASDCSEAQAARELLLERCILRAHRNGTPIAIRDLPAEAIEIVARRMAEAEPAGDLQLNLECQTCHHTWLLTLDISLFLWEKIKALAERLMREIHILARAYGWREQDILAMSPARRQFYLDMVS